MPISFSSPTNRDSGARGAGVTAVLGPTNTGKTHLAIERMLGHSSGIIGLPLRLLAREVYNKVAARVGAEAVALVTGEEKIKPPAPRYWVSTVEAMPRDLDVAFLAIDEVQLGADLERGHVFTDRILNRRGREETLVLAAHEERASGALSIRRRRISRRHRRHRHGAQSRRRSRRLRLRPQVRRLSIPQAQSRRARADRRPRRPRHPQRHLRHHRAMPAVRDRARAGARKPFVRADQGAAVAQYRARLLLGRRAAGLTGRAAERERAYPRADRRGYSGARPRRA